jgi:hypothetical protein
MNTLEHYILEVKEINVLQPTKNSTAEYLEIKALCDCWGDKRVYTHVTTRANWEREVRQGYFMA